MFSFGTIFAGQATTGIRKPVPVPDDILIFPALCRSGNALDECWPDDDQSAAATELLNPGPNPL